MNGEINNNVDKKELEKDIEELRDILNKICITAKTMEELEERLLVSQQLDRLIVRYMNKINE